MKKAYAGIIIFMMVFILYGNNYIQVGKDDDFNDDNNCCDSWEITEGGSYASIINMNDYGCTVEGVAPGYAVLTSYPSDPEYNEDVCSSYDITLFEAKIDDEIPIACDGDRVKLNFIIKPNDIPIENIELEAKGFHGEKQFVNILNKGIEFSGSDQDWAIVNARWYENSDDKCDHISPYLIGGKYTVNGKECDFDEVLFIVNAGGDCVNGECSLISWYNGQPTITRSQSGNTVTFTFTSIGNFSRNIQTEINIKTLFSSQYYNMVVAEENFHSLQYKGYEGNLFLSTKIWNVNWVWNSISGRSYSATSTDHERAETDAWNLAVDDYSWNLNTENDYSMSYFESIYCDVEKEAKNGINATYLSVIKCAYPDCN